MPCAIGRLALEHSAFRIRSADSPMDDSSESSRFARIDALDMANQDAMETQTRLDAGVSYGARTFQTTVFFTP